MTILCCLTLIVAALTVSAQPDEQQAEVEARLESVRQQIRQLQDERDSGDSQRTGLVTELRRLETDIGDLRREVRTLDAELEQINQQLAELAQRQQQGEQRLSEDRQHLGEQLALAYRLGRQSRLKLLFNLEDPTQTSRLLAYHGFFSRAQSARIRAVLDQLQELRDLATATTERQTALTQVREQRGARLQELQQAYDQRGGVLQSLDQRLATLSARIGELRANQRDLEQLLERLQDALVDIPDTLGDQPFRELLGQLQRPVNGRLTVAFGQPQEDNRPGTGVVFNANAGSEVASVGYGRVAFADWLRGFGLLMIIDHGDGYMSLYGRNEALLHEAGDWVTAGQVIAIVGQGNLDAPPGLYFELRKDGRAIDPQRWFKRSSR
ncbi:MAG: peptidoglycan DD-metalloendopeptidase family protein [Wenzhouxiangellaceae bacterium]